MMDAQVEELRAEFQLRVAGFQRLIAKKDARIRDLEAAIAACPGKHKIAPRRGRSRGTR